MPENFDFWNVFRTSLRYIELISVIIGTLMLYKYKHTFLKYFLVLLWYTVLNEFLGVFVAEYQLKHNLTQNNLFIYNIYAIVNFVVLLLIYWHYIHSKIFKKTIVFFITSYLISIIIDGFIKNPLTEGQNITYLLGSFYLIISIAFYFIEILNSEKVLYVQKTLLFWISIGLFLFHIGNIPFSIMENFYANIPDFKNMFYAKFILIAILYICYIIGFIWSDKKRQY